MKDPLRDPAGPENFERMFFWIFGSILLGLVICFIYWHFFGVLPRHTSRTPIQLCLQSLFGPLLLFVSGLQGGGAVASVATAILLTLAILSWFYRKYSLGRFFFGLMLLGWVIFGTFMIEVVSMMGI